MFVAIAKFLYLDLKDQKLKVPDPSNEVSEWESNGVKEKKTEIKKEEKNTVIKIGQASKKKPGQKCGC